MCFFSNHPNDAVFHPDGYGETEIAVGGSEVHIKGFSIVLKMVLNEEGFEDSIAVAGATAAALTSPLVMVKT